MADRDESGVSSSPGVLSKFLKRGTQAYKELAPSQSRPSSAPGYPSKSSLIDVS